MALGPSKLSRRSIIPMNVADSAAEFKRHDRSVKFIRPYKRSSTHKLRWSRELHESFMWAVNQLGGKDFATPKRIAQLMDLEEVTIAHVKSHLQMYRIGKINADGMPVHADDPVLFKPISKNALSSAQQVVQMSPEEQREVFLALQLLKEGKITGAARATQAAEKMIKGLEDMERYTTLASEGKMKRLEDVKTHEFIPATDESLSGSKRRAEDDATDESMSGRKRKAEDDIELDLTMATTPKGGAKLQFPSPSTPEEATLSLRL